MPKASLAKSASLYGVHPSVAMVQKWLTELKEETGRSIEEWLALVKREGPKDEKSRREWLKTKHKMGTNRASWIAERAEGKGWEDTPERTWRRRFDTWKSSTQVRKKSCGRFMMSCWRLVNRSAMT